MTTPARPIIAITAAITLAASLAACRTDSNNRAQIGDPKSPNAVSLTAMTTSGQRAEAPRSDSTPSLAGLSRAGWNRQTITVPLDGVHAYRRYARNFPQTEETARQRGDFPTPLTTLDMPEPYSEEQITEVLVSGPAALYEGLVMVPRFFFVRPCEEIRATPQPYWRAPVTTARFTKAEQATETSPASDPAAAPTPER